MAESTKGKKTEEPKGGRKATRSPGPAPKAATKAATKAAPKAGERAAVVKKLLEKLERQMSNASVKASMAEYIRLVQLYKELDEEAPREIKVTWNKSTFAAQYGHAMATITQNTVNPAAYPDEVAYLPTVIGNFTTAIMNLVRGTYPACRFEVLYPTDVNQTAFNQAINYPVNVWTPTLLDCLKTECFGFTFGRNLDKCWLTLDFGAALGFGAAQRSHLVGIGDMSASWLKETLAAKGKRFESVVLFALDQFCLIGYEVPLPEKLRRSFRSGI